MGDFSEGVCRLRYDSGHGAVKLEGSIAGMKGCIRKKEAEEATTDYEPPLDTAGTPKTPVIIPEKPDEHKEEEEHREEEEHHDEEENHKEGDHDAYADEFYKH